MGNIKTMTGFIKNIDDDEGSLVQEEEETEDEEDEENYEARMNNE